MVIYIEYVIIDNMIIDVLLVYFSLRLCRAAIRRWRVLTAAAFGTGLAVLAPLLNFSALPALIFKIAGSVIIILIAAEKLALKKLIRLYAVFLALTFAGGGAALMLVVLLNGSIENSIYMQYNYSVPIGFIIGGAFLGVRLVFGIIKGLEQQKDNKKWQYKVEIEIDKRIFETLGYVDSGNKVYDKGGLPVCFADKNLFGDAIDGDYNFISGDGKKKLRDSHFTEINTLTSKDKIFIFRPDKLKIYFESNVNTIYDVMIGISLTSIDKLGEDCRLILHPSVVRAV